MSRLRSFMALLVAGGLGLSLAVVPASALAGVTSASAAAADSPIGTGSMAGQLSRQVSVDTEAWPSKNRKNCGKSKFARHIKVYRGRYANCRQARRLAKRIALHRGSFGLWYCGGKGQGQAYGKEAFGRALPKRQIECTGFRGIDLVRFAPRRGSSTTKACSSRNGPSNPSAYVGLIRVANISCGSATRKLTNNYKWTESGLEIKNWSCRPKSSPAVCRKGSKRIWYEWGE